MTPAFAPDAAFWTTQLAWIAGETAAIALLTGLAQWRVRAPAIRKLIWRAALVVALLTLAAEATGLAPAAGQWLKPASPQPPPSNRNLTVQVTTFPANWEVGDRVWEPPAATPPPIIKPSPVWWPAWIWLGGAGLMLALRALAGTLLWGLRRRMRPITDPEINERIRQLAARLEVRKSVRLLCTAQVKGPFTFGGWRPAIVLPEGFTGDFNRAQQDAILAHELGHIAGRDLLWQRLGAVLVALLWWHPAAWWMHQQLANASEQAADEACLVVENGPEALAESLVLLGRRMSHALQPILLGVEGAGFRSALARRVECLWAMRAQPVRRSGWRHLIMSIAGSVLACGGLTLFATVLPRHDSADAAWQHSLISMATEALAKQEQARRRPPNKPLDELDQAIAVAAVEFQRMVDELVREGRILYEVSRFDEAEAKLKEAIKLSPENKAAAHYLRLARERKSARVNRDLQTRMFNVNKATIEKNLKGIKRLSTEAAAMNQADPLALFSAMLADLGVRIEPPKSMFFNDRTGQLMVRASIEDFEIIEKALPTVNQAPPQLTIEARFCEVAGENGKPPDFAKLLGITLSNITATPSQAKEHRAALAQSSVPYYGTGVGVLADTNAPAATLAGVLTAAQHKEVLRRLEKQKVVDLLSMPSVTTLSGRQAQIKVVDIKYVVVGMTNNAATDAARATGQPADLVPMTEPFEFGPVLDVVPSVLADGQTIQMTVIPKIREFLGYDEQTKGINNTVIAPGKTIVGPVPPTPFPEPRFRQRLVVCNAAVRDGQTLVLAGGLLYDEVITAQGAARRAPKEKPAKSLLIFVTPTLIDDRGNRLHGEENPMKENRR